MNARKLGALLIAGILLPVCAGGVASAASVQTRMFMDNVTPNVDFLDRSSRMALDKSKDARIKEFARSEAILQTNAANAFYDFSQGAGRIDVASASTGDGLISGRSAAVTGQVATIDNRLPMGQEDLDSLEGLAGKSFDEDYKTKQLNALMQIETDYTDYIAKGDDPVLLGIANRELPKVQHQISTLRKL